MKHTPTPWKYEAQKGSDSRYEIYSDGAWIATVYHGYGQPDLNETHSNAEFICRAANCHDDLLEALENMIAQFAKYTPKLNHAKCWEIIQAKAILAKATKQ